MFKTMLLRGDYANASPTPVPQLTRHPLIRPGTRLALDLYEPLYHPGGIITPGAMATGRAYQSLVYPNAAGVDTGALATVSGAGFVQNGDGSIELPGVGGPRIDFGVAGQFDIAPAEIEQLCIVWLRIPANGFSAGAYQPIIQLTRDNANTSQIWMDMGVNGLRPRAAIGDNGTGSPATGLGADIAAPVLGAPMQLACHFKPGTLTFFFNGLPIGATPCPRELVSAATATLQIPGLLKGRIYGVQLIDIGASIAAETAMGLPADTIWSAQQHVAKDWLLGTGALPGWESTAYS